MFVGRSGCFQVLDDGVTLCCATMQVAAVASDDGSIRCFNTRNGELICELQGHEDAVQAALFDSQPPLSSAAACDASSLLISCGSDATFKIWS